MVGLIRKADVAQWESTPLVRERSWVQAPSSAPDLCGSNGRSGLVAQGFSLGSPGLESKPEAVCGSNSVVESQPSKLLVAGSIPVSRSKTQEGNKGRSSSKFRVFDVGFRCRSCID